MNNLGKDFTARLATTLRLLHYLRRHPSPMTQQKNENGEHNALKIDESLVINWKFHAAEMLFLAYFSLLICCSIR